MLAKTHLIFGLLIGLLTFQYFEINKYLFIFIVLLGAILPDIDEKDSYINKKLKISKIIGYIFKHRGFFHSLFFVFLICLLFYYTLGPNYAYALLIGITSHLIADSLTKSGINFFHPFKIFRISGFVTTGSLFETVLLIILIIIIVLVILK